MNTRIGFVVFGITLLITMGVSSLIPALPLLAKTFGVHPEISGLIIAAYALPGFFCIPIAGVLSDRYGRKATLLPALLLFTAGGIACTFASSFMELLAYRVVQGVGAAALGILYNTIIADTWENQSRVKMMSYNAMALGIGTAVSPALGGTLTLISWQMPFLLVLLAVPIFFLALTVSLMRPERAVSFRAYGASLLACLRSEKTLRLLALGLLTSLLLFGPVVTCFPLLATHFFAASAFDIGIIMAVPSLVSGIAAWRLAHLFSRFTPRTLLFAGLGLYFLAFLLMPFMPSLWWLALPLLLFGFAQGITIPLCSLLLTGQAPAEQRAALMATHAVLLRAAQTVAPLAFSGLAIHVGITVAILLATLIVGGMALLVMRIGNEAK